MKWGILGFGYMGKKFLAESKNLVHISVVAVATLSQKSAEDELIKFFPSYEELINNSNLDGLYISTIPTKHLDIIKLGMSKNLPILCEKPLFFSSEEILEFNKLKLSSYVTENISFMFNTKIVELIRKIKHGYLGNLIEVTIKLQRKLNPNARHRIMNPLTSRGALHDFGMYGVYFLNVLFENLSILHYDLSYDGLNDFEGKIDFLGNDTVRCYLSYSIELENKNEIIVRGTDGVIKFEDFFSKNIKLSVTRKIKEYPFGENLNSKYENKFSNVISKVSDEIISKKIESIYTPLNVSILTATSMFQIIDKVTWK